MRSILHKSGWSAFVLTAIFAADFALGQNQPTLTARPAPKGHYDEVFVDAKDDKGRTIKIVRPQYRDVVDAVADFDEERILKIENRTTRDFKGDNALTVLPRVFVDSEYDGIIKPGIDQRGRALREFLRDFHSTNGHPGIARAGIVPQELLDYIVNRKLERAFVGQVNTSMISMLYGPDIIRDRDGQFRVVEDNFGYLGGFGDLKLALDSLYKNVREYPKLHERDPRDFFRELVRRYKERAKPYGGKVVVLMSPPFPDNEALRVRDLFAAEGILTVMPNSRAKLEFDSIGVWYRATKTSRRQRVGFVFLEGDNTSFDYTHATTKSLGLISYAHRLLPELARRRREERWNKNAIRAGRRFVRIMKNIDPVTMRPNEDELIKVLKEMGHYSNVLHEQAMGFPGLMDAMLTGKVATSHMPGTSFVEDKAFNPYVEKLIEFYLQETPILKGIPTFDVRISKGNGQFGELNEKFLSLIESRPERFVIKVVDGRGGNGIWIGAKVSKEEFEKGIEKLRAEPDRYKVQPYFALSVVGDMITDLRVHSDIPPRGQVFVSDTGWSRSLPLGGNGKVNISGEGRESTVIVRSAEKFCPMLFAPVADSAIYRAR